MSTPRVARTFRITEEAADLLAKAAEETDLSQAYIIESCLLKHIDSVRAEGRERREKMREAASVRAVGQGHEQSAEVAKGERGAARKMERPAASKRTAGLNIKQSN